MKKRSSASQEDFMKLNNTEPQFYGLSAKKDLIVPYLAVLSKEIHSQKPFSSRSIRLGEKTTKVHIFDEL